MPESVLSSSSALAAALKLCGAANARLPQISIRAENAVLLAREALKGEVLWEGMCLRLSG